MFPNDDNKVGDEPQQDDTAVKNDYKEPENLSTESEVASEINPVTNKPADPNTPLPDTSKMFQASPALSAPKKSRKKLLAIGIASILVLGGIGGYVFGLYIPSQPDNVYSKAMDRTGKALDKVTEQISDKSQLDKLKKAQYQGTLKIDSSDMQVSGTMDLKYDGKRVDFSGDAKLSEGGQTEKKYSAKVLSEIKDNTMYPDVYILLSGIKDFGLESFVPRINTLDDTWIKIDEKFIKDNIEQLQKNISNGGDTDVTKQSDITTEDTAELSRVMSGVAKEYVFSNDNSKSIFVKKRFVGKENVEGLKTYRYEIAINKDNFEKACIEASNRIHNTSFYKKTTNSKEDDIQKSKEEDKKACQDTKNQIKDDLKVDMWVDAKYKLIHKISYLDPKTPKTYVEVGQIYKGGDDLHFFATFNNSESKTVTKLTIDTNTKTLVSKSKLTVNFEADGKKGSTELTVDGKPMEGDIKLDKPSNPKTIQQVIEELSLGSGEEDLDPLGIEAEDPFSIDPAFEL